jgi:hypothetical protein
MEPMISRRLIGHGLAAAMTLGLCAAGCSNHPKTTPTDTKTGESASARGIDVAPSDRGTGAAGTAQDESFNAAEALKRKTSAYSQQVESMMGEGKGAGATPPTSAPSVATRQQPSRPQPPVLPPKKSQVEWGDPTQQPLSPTGGAGAGPGNPNVKEVSTWSNTPITADKSNAEAAPPGNVGSAASGPNDPMAQKIEKRVKEYPRDLSGHLDFQLLRFLQDERVPELNTISALPTEDRELLAAVVDGLSNFRSGLRQDNNMLPSRKIRPLMDMADRLRGVADLSVPTIALCTDVRTFGEYTPINPPRFAANKSHDVILYCEVENFSSQLDDQHMWVTKLAKEAVLYTENGMPVWSDKTEAITDTARRRRHDFFIVKKLRLPANLAVGRYLMKVSIQDQQVNRVAEATLPIIVAAD